MVPNSGEKFRHQEDTEARKEFKLATNTSYLSNFLNNYQQQELLSKWEWCSG